MLIQQAYVAYQVVFGVSPEVEPLYPLIQGYFK
jgi:hypothetical protein